MEGVSAGKHLSEVLQAQSGSRCLALRLRWCGAQCAIPELVDRDGFRRVGRDPKHRVEGPVARLDPLVSAHYHERVSDRVEDRFSAFAFVNGLIDGGAESGQIRES